MFRQHDYNAVISEFFLIYKRVHTSYIFHLSNTNTTTTIATTTNNKSYFSLVLFSIWRSPVPPWDLLSTLYVLVQASQPIGLMSSAVSGVDVIQGRERTLPVCSLVTVWRRGAAEEDNFF